MLTQYAAGWESTFLAAPQVHALLSFLFAPALAVFPLQGFSLADVPSAPRVQEPGDHLMPCHEYCGVGHEGMWANVKVIDKATFMNMGRAARRVSCVK